ncbi:uncharacterized protein VDAG_02368 [Verticillium dahliae VdLs.17]|uniref:DUF7924 domain-containing protein n=1 Tax=Verticillium dahliae (strain VdLs.17 / ATCC MYA-4575 / FGSC 10137) TaxID=498257 RepID=G2WXN6_VERDV|nr:uncharacterized protein VDAG_02368 [Verticillium dahliae VdLs.17]EGY20844.1 hypothetical protein VDAG_02368 [Verticillium dahliae VdLs.17]
MSSSKSSPSGGSKSTNPPSTVPTSVTNKSKRSTPYNRDFEQHLTDHGVHATSSLSPSKFSDGAFEAFQENNARAKDEDDVLANVIPVILGPNQTIHLSARNTIFGNLEQLTDGTIAPAKPDIYYGTYPEELSRPARNELARHIIPSSMQDKPMAPNFFVEVKGPDGSVAVATRQARYDGAVGSRGMHSLQNYGREEPQYDGRTYTFSSTYHNGQLQMYAHHLTAPTIEGGPPEYHMSQVKAFALTNDRDTFVQGATAFRNARDVAKQHRDDFIRAANAKPPQQTVTAPQGDPISTIQSLLDDESSDEFVDCTDSPLPDTHGESVAGATNVDECIQAYALPELGDSATSFTSSFMSGFTAGSAKRSRQPLSPDSKFAARSPPSKSRALPGISRRTHKPPVIGLSSTADVAEHLWPCFDNDVLYASCLSGVLGPYSLADSPARGVVSRINATDPAVGMMDRVLPGVSGISDRHTGRLRQISEITFSAASDVGNFSPTTITDPNLPTHGGFVV